jgi:hypothetical protein
MKPETTEWVQKDEGDMNNAHRDLDNAVAEAYGWHADISDDKVLNELLELNKSRS